jgi:hypothetical protein
VTNELFNVTFKCLCHLIYITDPPYIFQLLGKALTDKIQTNKRTLCYSHVSLARFYRARQQILGNVGQQKDVARPTRLHIFIAFKLGRARLYRARQQTLGNVGQQKDVARPTRLVLRAKNILFSNSFKMY